MIPKLPSYIRGILAVTIAVTAPVPAYALRQPEPAQAKSGLEELSNALTSGNPDDLLATLGLNPAAVHPEPSRRSSGLEEDDSLEVLQSFLQREDVTGGAAGQGKGIRGRTLTGIPGQSYDAIVFDQFNLPSLLSELLSDLNQQGPFTWADVATGPGVAPREGARKFSNLQPLLVDVVRWEPSQYDPATLEALAQRAREVGVEDMFSSDAPIHIADALTVNMKSLAAPGFPLRAITMINALGYNKDPLGIVVNLFNQLEPGGLLLTNLYIPMKRGVRDDSGTVIEEEPYPEGDRLAEFYGRLERHLKALGVDADFRIRDFSKMQKGERNSQGEEGPFKEHAVGILLRKKAGQQLKLLRAPARLEEVAIVNSAVRLVTYWVADYGEDPSQVIGVQAAGLEERAPVRILIADQPQRPTVPGAIEALIQSMGLQGQVELIPEQGKAGDQKLLQRLIEENEPTIILVFTGKPALVDPFVVAAAKRHGLRLAVRAGAGYENLSLDRTIHDDIPFLRSHGLRESMADYTLRAAFSRLRLLAGTSSRPDEGDVSEDPELGSLFQMSPADFEEALRQATERKRGEMTEEQKQLMFGPLSRREFFELVPLLKDQRVGVLGFGEIGQEVAIRLEKLRKLKGVPPFEIAVTSPSVLDPASEEAAFVRQLGDIRIVSPEELYRTADILTVHVPSNDANKGLIRPELFAGRTKPLTLINTARWDLMHPAMFETGLPFELTFLGDIDFVDSKGVLDQKVLALRDAHPKTFVVAPHIGGLTRGSAEGAVKNLLGVLERVFPVLLGKVDPASIKTLNKRPIVPVVPAAGGLEERIETILLVGSDEDKIDQVRAIAEEVFPSADIQTLPLPLPANVKFGSIDVAILVEFDEDAKQKLADAYNHGIIPHLIAPDHWDEELQDYELREALEGFRDIGGLEETPEIQTYADIETMHEAELRKAGVQEAIQTWVAGQPDPRRIPSPSVFDFSGQQGISADVVHLWLKRNRYFVDTSGTILVWEKKAPAGGLEEAATVKSRIVPVALENRVLILGPKALGILKAASYLQPTDASAMPIVVVVENARQADKVKAWARDLFLSVEVINASFPPYDGDVKKALEMTRRYYLSEKGKTPIVAETLDDLPEIARLLGVPEPEAFAREAELEALQDLESRNL